MVVITHRHLELLGGLRSLKKVCRWHGWNASAGFTVPVSRPGLSITQAAVPFISMTASGID
ncbi:hypothetical protein PG999_005946 [Apiospora kogelbergensis]|uniref:Uncharacterized protein n=1 Tax=Apiospora kogelbergensis TaxID=1337665 RepID=A0AAW0QQU9_9PEZI